MRYIGDVHGKFNQYLDIIKDCDASIQVGDFGAGFKPLPEIGSNHRFIRGNHDDPAICLKSPNWIPDLTVEGRTFFVGGAFSIDRGIRTIGIDWWHNEELSTPELYQAIDLYQEIKPQIMVSHDAPVTVMKGLFSYSDRGSRTANAFDAMFEAYQPVCWIFGHWHRDIRVNRLGTEFICLAELSYIDI